MPKEHQTLVRKLLSKPEVKKEYDALEEEFALLTELVRARKKAGKTQEDIAHSMKTSTSVVGRLETGGGTHRHSPTIATLYRYAHAVNCGVKIKLVPHDK